MTDPVKLAKAYEELKSLSGYCPDHFDESPDCQMDCASYIRDHMTTLFEALQTRAPAAAAPFPATDHGFCENPQCNGNGSRWLKSGHKLCFVCRPAPAVDLTKCPRCGGPADNGFDRCDPPSPYHCTKCDAVDDLEVLKIDTIDAVIKELKTEIAFTDHEKDWIEVGVRRSIRNLAATGRIAGVERCREGGE